MDAEIVEDPPSLRVDIAVDPSESMRTCPICGASLLDRACKLRCPTQGCPYFLSCSDFY